MVLRKRASAFTLVELIASAAVITLLMLMLVQMSKSTADTWRKGVSKAEQFRESLRAYELMTRRLSQATLNAYWDYEYPPETNPNDPGTTPPKGYLRQSELRFRTLKMKGVGNGEFHPTHGVFFQSPSASTDPEDDYWKKKYSKNDRRQIDHLDGMLNTWGYFLEVADTTASMPGFLAQDAQPRWRSRLMELREDTKDLSVFKLDRRRAGDDWFTTPMTLPTDKRPVHVVAENIIAMILLPRLSAIDEKTRAETETISAEYKLLSPNFEYDSKKNNNYGGGTVPSAALPYQINPKNQLPPVVQVAMFALDEPSANRMANDAKDKNTLDMEALYATLFEKADQLEYSAKGPGDLSLLEKKLTELHMNYRLFVSHVGIKGSRWSAAQNND